jgi:glycogen debranching enzyme
MPIVEFVGDTIAEAEFSIPATGPSTRPRRTLKHGDSFAVLDSHGDMGAVAGGADGLFHCDTRFLSRLELRFNGAEPLLLGSNVSDDNSRLNVDLTNPDILIGERYVCRKDTIHIVRTIFLWRGRAYQRLGIRNHGDEHINFELSILFGSAMMKS